MISIKNILVAILILASILVSGSAWSLERYALLIANENYNNEIGKLSFPSKDILVLEKSLLQLGFKVKKFNNLGLLEFNKAIREHINTVNTNSGGSAVPESFVYYAGHGAADAATKVNYLIPVDVTEASTEKLWDGSVNLQLNVLETLKRQAPKANHYIVIDACRNELKLRDKNRALTIDGKAFVAPAPVHGMLIAYATAENETTPDDGEYARSLAKALLVEDDDIVVVFRKVQMEIQKRARRFPYAVAIGVPQTHFARMYSQEPVMAKPIIGPESLFDSVVLNNDCPEITVMDYSKYPPISKIERRCLPGKVK